MVSFKLQELIIPIMTDLMILQIVIVLGQQEELLVLAQVYQTTESALLIV